MSTLCISLLGKFSARRNEKIVEGIDCHRLQELLCYLLLFRDAPHAREVLAGVLWGGCSMAQSRTYLRKALWQIQAALDRVQQDGDPPLLIVEVDWVKVNPLANIWTDIKTLEGSFELVEGRCGEQISSAEAEALQCAVALYRGDLLAGSYVDWCLVERERLQNIYLALLDKLMGFCEGQGLYERGLIYGGQALRYDRAREQIHRRLMRLHFKNGDRTAALRQYASCVAALEAELSVKPSDQTVDLYEQVRANRLSELTHEVAVASQTGSPALRLHQIIERLKQFNQRAAQMQAELQNYIAIVEELMQGPPQATPVTPGTPAHTSRGTI